MPHPLDPNWYAIDRKERHLVSVGWFGGMVKVCQIMFHSDALFVLFPYHPDVDGLVGRCEVGPGSDTTTINLAEGGRITSHKVKYSHWASGDVHFSQTGRVRTEIRS